MILRVIVGSVSSVWSPVIRLLILTSESRQPPSDVRRRNLCDVHRGHDETAPYPDARDNAAQ